MHAECFVISQVVFNASAVSPSLSCEATSDQASGLITVKCAANGVPDETICDIDGTPFPCESIN